MRKLLSHVGSPAVFLYVFLIITAFAEGLYSASGFERPPAFTLVKSAALLWLFGWWALRDSRHRGVEWIDDLGFFLTVAWPLVIPYYLLKTRGAKGLLLIVGFIATFIAALFAGALFWWALAISTGRLAIG